MRLSGEGGKTGITPQLRFEDGRKILRGRRKGLAK
jgi:hypothetical protein